MIPEILDYLLTKSKFLIMPADKIVEQLTSETDLDAICYCINLILNTDVFFQTSDELINKLDYLIYKKRFEGRHCNNTIRYFNDMVDKIKAYQKITEKYKLYLQSYYVRDEANNRNLPFRKIPGYTLDIIYKYVIKDYPNAKAILTCDADYEFEDLFSSLSTINFLGNCYPKVFEENPNSLSYASAISFKCQMDGGLVLKHMANNTQKLLDKIEQELLISNIHNKDVKIKMKTNN